MPSSYPAWLCIRAVWKSKKLDFTKAQVDPMDALKNKHICILRYYFWWKTLLANEKTWVLPKYTRFSKTPNKNQRGDLWLKEILNCFSSGILENLVYFGKTHVFEFSNVKMDVLEYCNILGKFVFVRSHEIFLIFLENQHFWFSTCPNMDHLQD